MIWAAPRTSATRYSHLDSSTGPVPSPANSRQLPSASCAAPCGRGEGHRVDVSGAPAR